MKYSPADSDRISRQERSVLPAALVLLLPLLFVAGMVLQPPLAAAAVQAGGANALTAAEKAAGWILLFDGKSFAGWRGLGYDGVPAKHWVIEDGAIKKIPSKDVPLQADGQPAKSGDLMTVAAFADFELTFEWKISAGGNSGVKYNVSEGMSMRQSPNHAALGFEYQVLDDLLHSDAKNGPHRTAGALYDLVPPGPAKVLKPAGAWNSARIVLRGGHGEHWLNGVKILEYDLASPDFKARLAKSKYAPIAGFADRRSGHIVLQDHTDAAWYRNIRIKAF
ncbi:MAG: DUF1080 domain-containing protein [Acidobacteriota bacterium]|nr:DUF1080 domain-containing protein [Acidobacteriota bacterium]